MKTRKKANSNHVSARLQPQEQFQVHLEGEDLAEAAKKQKTKNVNAKKVKHQRIRLAAAHGGIKHTKSSRRDSNKEMQK